MRASADVEEREEDLGPPRISVDHPATPASDAEREILGAVRVGDRRAAVALCARHHGAAVGRVCMAILGSQSEADDIVQETLIAAYAGLEAFRGECSVLGWLIGIARRKCARQLERRARHDAKLRLVRDSERPQTDELLARRRRAERARAALEGVRPSEREALLLRYVGELSYRDVGAACGIDEVAARKRVSRALAQLRNVLANEE